MINDIKHWAPPVAVVLVGVTATQLITADMHVGWQLAAALAGGVTAAIVAVKLGILTK